MLAHTLYRGYNVEGEWDGRRWLLHIHPSRPELPILRQNSFTAIPTWMRALGGAKRRVNETLAPL